ncbi:MAG: uracil phosphoribosyltransferase [Bacteroidales bacterium]|nr:uracil phosphoribosyltransferase [Bacteroidales bacterium]
MQINIINRQDSVINNYLSEIRDVDVQTDPLRFRRNIERIGSLMAYEVSKTLSYSPKDVRTPLGVATVNVPSNEIVVGTILRAGLPMHHGVLDVFDHAQNCFISAYRKYISPNEFEINLEYVATAHLDDKILIIADPMLATGNSIEATYQALKKYGKPKHTHIMSILGAQPGVDYLLNSIKDENVTLWVAAVDEQLNDHKYIVPGLGDAGDLAYGYKI